MIVKFHVFYFTDWIFALFKTCFVFFQETRLFWHLPYLVHVILLFLFHSGWILACLLCFLSVTLFHPFANFLKSWKIASFFPTLCIIALFRTYCLTFSNIVLFWKLTYLELAILLLPFYWKDYCTFSCLHCFLLVTFWFYCSYI